jgi:hypothetical protein
MVRKTKIINANFQETVYRIDVLGDVVAYVDWHKNSVTIDPTFFVTPAKFPSPDALSKIDAQIKNVKNLKLDLYRGEKVWAK